MKWIVAPDSYKGSADAVTLCRAMEAGIRRVLPEAEVVHLPMADGGEGTMDNLVLATGGVLVKRQTFDPLGRPIEGRYGVLGDGQTVVIELAEASGLTLLLPEERNPLVASTYGTGCLIRHALDDGYRTFVIGLGGSATNDGGAGLLHALGVRLIDQRQTELPPGGAALADLAGIDLSALDPRLASCSFTIASDVRNPLCGPDGASAVFGPQKGASPSIVETLDRALQRFADVLEKAVGKRIADAPGSGAAGGTGAALLACLNAEMQSGAQLVMAKNGFANHLIGTDFVLTGEGRLDGQTASGKAISAVCQQARAAGVPVIALCGSVEPIPDLCARLGLTAAVSIVPGPCTLEEAQRHTELWVANQAANIAALAAR